MIYTVNNVKLNKKDKLWIGGSVCKFPQTWVSKFILNRGYSSFSKYVIMKTHKCASPHEQLEVSWG